MVVLHPDTDFDQLVVKHPSGCDAILVMVDGKPRAYRNSCPHVGVGLDWGDGRCLSAPGELTCAMHGARFSAETGACFAGPCAGRSLTALPVRVVDGRVVCDGAV